MTHDQSRELLEKIKANHAALDACGRHDFEPSRVDFDGGPLPSFVASRYRCKNCGGIVDAHAQHWYELGLSHQRSEEQAKQ